MHFKFFTAFPASNSSPDWPHTCSLLVISPSLYIYVVFTAATILPNRHCHSHVWPFNFSLFLLCAAPCVQTLILDDLKKTERLCFLRLFLLFWVCICARFFLTPHTWFTFITRQRAWGSAADEQAQTDETVSPVRFNTQNPRSILLCPCGKPDLITYLLKYQYLHKLLGKTCVSSCILWPLCQGFSAAVCLCVDCCNWSCCIKPQS